MFRRPRKPAFAIAFVTIRFFIPFSQSHSKFRIVSQSSLKAFPQISLLIHKIVRQSSQVVKHREIGQASSLAEQFQPRNSRREIAPKFPNCLGKDSALSILRLFQSKFSTNEKCRNILFVCRLP